MMMITLFKIQKLNDMASLVKQKESVTLEEYINIYENKGVMVFLLGVMVFLLVVPLLEHFCRIVLLATEDTFSGCKDESRS